ncbi:MAG: polyprenol phosphomannose-dependent alpha 1,6 mannosyltransferase MptB [Actinomycetota bacterium]|nr:polyprenol phosphomannose-dependent alpha 1,6 mannosyltransferase MptB [Actinomycetota bacterium]
MGWGAVGLAGSLVVTLTSPSLAGAGVNWWYRISIGHGAAEVLLYAGIALLAGAWLGLGRTIWGAPDLSLNQLRLVGAVWCAPLIASAPLFSHDVYSYLAQGTILHLGLNPYHTVPEALAGLGQQHLLAGVSPFWRHTTAPYGPLFLGLASTVVSVTGSHTTAGVLLLRGLELGGAILLAIFVPRLARSCGGDPRRALWLAVLSPLVLLQLIGAGHNDALMAGITVAGVSLAIQGRPLPGIALCTLAATVKLPAAVAVVFIAVTWARSMPDGAQARAALIRSAALAAGVLLLVSLVIGVGADWISTTVFSTPERVRLAITPATAVGRTLAGLMHGVGVAVNARSLEAALATGAFAATVVAGVIVLWRTRTETMVRNLGLLLLAAAIAGPAAWPWYLSWGFVLVAAWPGLQRSPVLVLSTVVSVFLVKPDGILALPLSSAPVVLAVYALVGWGVWYRWRRRSVQRRSGELGTGSSVLAET